MCSFHAYCWLAAGDCVDWVLGERHAVQNQQSARAQEQALPVLPPLSPLLRSVNPSLHINARLFTPLTTYLAN